MMATNRFRKRAILLAAALVGGALVGGYLYMSRARNPIKPLPTAPICAIHFLTADERAERPRAADNPVLVPYDTAEVRFHNSSQGTIEVYDLDRTPSATSQTRDAFIVGVEVRDAAGSILDGFDWEQDSIRSLVKTEIVPTTEWVLSKTRARYTVLPGGTVGLPMSILGRVTEPRRGLKPGAYTVRATVTYAEAAVRRNPASHV